MFSVFALPKPFHDHIATIQRNAIQSWMQLHPTCEIILFGSEEGTSAIAAEFGVRHIPEIARNEYATPLLNDIFEKAYRVASYPTLVYVNADIILLPDFSRAIAQVAQVHHRFLLVGQRWNTDITETLDFLPGWDEKLRAYVQQHGILHDVVAIDYFVFTRDTIGALPPFAIGRAGWDNWMIYRARSQGIVVIDATASVMAVHQNHDYAHLQGGQFAAYEGLEAVQNRQAAGIQAYFNIHDATYRLTSLGLVPNLNKACLWQRLNRQTTLSRFRGTSRIRYILLRVLIWVWKLFIVCMPFKEARQLVYQWLARAEERRGA
jgi:hypothetical protein